MPTVTTTATTAPLAARRRARQRPFRPEGWLDARDILERGLFGSFPSLDRAVRRAEDDNPFPKPSRDRLTQRRFWKEQDVEAWAAREPARAAGRLVCPGRASGGGV